jgi:hypothetical protein
MRRAAAGEGICRVATGRASAELRGAIRGRRRRGAAAGTDEGNYWE